LEFLNFLFADFGFRAFACALTHFLKFGCNVGNFRPRLCGHAHTTKSGIQALQHYADDQANCVLLCMEEHPADCHRPTSITGPHFPGALHIYRDRLFFSSELSRVDAGEIGFDALMSVSWDDWLDVLRNHP
jgi:hypothetical protein